MTHPDRVHYRCSTKGSRAYRSVRDFQHLIREIPHPLRRPNTRPGIVMVVYLDEAFARYMAEGRIQKPEDVDAAVIEGASARVRPLVMTVATTVLGLLPLLWEAGVGTDVSARTAAAAYAMWRRHQVRAALSVAVLHEVTPEPGGAA
jgi:hypothetical protein